MRRFFFELRYLIGNAPWDTGVSPPELIDYMRTHPPGRAIDLGCGTGTNAMTMAGFGWSVLGIDISILAIYLARRKAANSNADVRFIRGDVAHLSTLDDPYDLVLDIGCFHAMPIEKRDDYMHHLQKSTHIGSDFLLYTWLQVKPEDPEIAPTQQALEQRLEPFFHIVDLTLGTDHDRTSAWVLASRSA